MPYIRGEYATGATETRLRPRNRGEAATAGAKTKCNLIKLNRGCERVILASFRVRLPEQNPNSISGGVNSILKSRKMQPG